MSDKPIYVTQPSLPPLKEFIPYLERIWENKILTNNGPFHQQLEQQLCDYLGVEHLSLFTNGTIALVTALQALRISGEVITTPYSFAATTHALLWNKLTPVFVDIDPITCNLDPAGIEAAITPRTTAILPVHCYGNPCAVEETQRLADIYGLKVIYDAAHTFGVQYRNESILNHGDLSVLSFHATKVFNTFEGGAIICPDAGMKQQVDYLKNFGFADEVTVIAAGINGKMSEINASFGLVQLKHIDQALDESRAIAAYYRQALTGVKGIRLLPQREEVIENAAYFPIFVENEYPKSRDELYFKLKEAGIHGRRYFSPLISTFPMYKRLPSATAENLPVATQLAQQVLCLPIYPDLPKASMKTICNFIRS